MRPQQPGWRPHRGSGCYAETGGGCKTPHPHAHNLAKRRKEPRPRELPPGTQPGQGACVMLTEAPAVLLPWHGPRGAFHDTDPPLSSPPLPSSPHPPTPLPPPTPIPHAILGYSDPAFCLPSPSGVPHPYPRAAGSQTVQHQSVTCYTHTHTHTHQPSYSDNLPYHILYSRAIASREKHESSNVTMTVRGRHRERRLTHPSLL